MQTPDITSATTAAVLAMVDIKAAAESFDRGDRNLFDALDAIAVVVEAYVAQRAVRRDAA